MTSIHRLKQKEYAQGAQLSLDNAKDLLKTSESAAEIDNFSLATSLCVLAVEEMAKSVILKFKSINNSVPIRNFDQYFRKHDVKHNAAIDLYFAIESQFEKKTKNKIESEFPDEAGLIVVAIIALLVYSAKNDEIKEPVKKSRSPFDELKETGFYVGYDEVRRRWKSPRSESDKENYEIFSELSREFANKIDQWIFNGTLDRKSINEFLASLSDDIVDKQKLAVL